MTLQKEQEERQKQLHILISNQAARDKKSIILGAGCLVIGVISFFILTALNNIQDSLRIPWQLGAHPEITSVFEVIGMGCLVVFIFGIFTGLALICVYVLKENKGMVPPGEWLRTVDHCQYKYAYDGSGIALDTSNRSIILLKNKNNQPITKIYSYDDVREWSYLIPGYTTTRVYGNVGIGAALAVDSQNWDNKVNAINNTGFTIMLKDIDNPDWFIKFCRNDTVATDLKRWMEIFNQYVNENRVDTDQPSDVKSKNFCRSCGSMITESTKFCTKCGSKTN